MPGQPTTLSRHGKRASATTAALLCGLVAALLLLQTLGVVHAVVHHTAQGFAFRRPVPAMPAGWAVQAPAERRATAPTAGGRAEPGTTTAAAAAPKPAGGWADVLFAGHDAGSSACALYDQLVQPPLPVDTACSANPAFAPPLPADPPRVGQLAPQAVGFLARGPPPARAA